MGQLEITFRIGLAHPLLALAAPSAPIIASIQETGNTVYVDPPDHRAATEEQSKMGAFARFTVRVRRECTDQEGRECGYYGTPKPPHHERCCESLLAVL